VEEETFLKIVWELALVMLFQMVGALAVLREIEIVMELAYVSEILRIS
jgi:hypothetical protein